MGMRVVHYALDVVATSSDDVRVIRVADVHFHDHSSALFGEKWVTIKTDKFVLCFGSLTLESRLLRMRSFAR